MKEINNEISLPCLKGRMGDWVYYVTLLSFKEVAARVKLPKEIDKRFENQEELLLGEWIQREIKSSRIKHIVEYLKSQDQRFFNSLILGMYEGKPRWSEINVKSNEIFNDEVTLDYMSKTFGVLTLSGKESIFAVDGQHRAYSIRKALIENKNLADDEICSIFIAHKTDLIGKERTRRLFSTLNRYAKPVNKKEIIALSEDDNCALITRKLVEEYKPFKNRILISGNKSVAPTAEQHFTSIIELYELVERILTNKSLAGYSPKNVTGENRRDYTNTRISENKIISHYKFVSTIFTIFIKTVPSLNDFFYKNKPIKRSLQKTSLLFRPIGQTVMVDVYKAALIENKTKSAINYFKKDDFNLNNKVWKEVFWNTDTKTIQPDPYRQRYASLLIMENLGFNINRTKKDIEIYNNFGFKASDI